MHRQSLDNQGLLWNCLQCIVSFLVSRRLPSLSSPPWMYSCSFLVLRLYSRLRDLSLYSRKPTVYCSNRAESRFILPRNLSAATRSWPAAAVAFPTRDCPNMSFSSLSSHPAACKTPTPQLWTSVQCWLIQINLEEGVYFSPHRMNCISWQDQSGSLLVSLSLSALPSPTPRAPSIRAAPSILPTGISTHQRCQRPLYHY